MPVEGLMLIAVLIGGLLGFGLTFGPMRALRRPVAILGTIAVIALSLAFLGYPQLSDFAESNAATAFLMAVGVAFAGVSAITDLLGM